MAQVMRFQRHAWAWAAAMTLAAAEARADGSFLTVKELTNPETPLPAIDADTLKRELPRLLRPLLAPINPKTRVGLPGDGIATHFGFRAPGLCPEATAAKTTMKVSGQSASFEGLFQLAPCFLKGWESVAATSRQKKDVRAPFLAQAPTVEQDEAKIFMRQKCPGGLMEGLKGWDGARLMASERQENWNLCTDDAERHVLVNAAYAAKARVANFPLVWQSQYLMAAANGGPCVIKVIDGETVLNDCRVISVFTANDVFEGQATPQRFGFSAVASGLRGTAGDPQWRGGFYELQLNQWRGQLILPGGDKLPRWTMRDGERNSLSGTLDPASPAFPPGADAAAEEAARAQAPKTRTYFGRSYAVVSDAPLSTPAVVWAKRPDTGAWAASLGRIVKGSVVPGGVFSEAPLRAMACPGGKAPKCWATNGQVMGDVARGNGAFTPWPADVVPKDVKMKVVPGMAHLKSQGLMLIALGKPNTGLYQTSVVGAKKLRVKIAFASFDPLGLTTDARNRNAFSLATVVAMQGHFDRVRPQISFLVRVAMGNTPAIYPLALSVPIPFDATYPNNSVQLFARDEYVYALVHTRIPPDQNYHATQTEGEPGTWLYRIQSETGDVALVTRETAPAPATNAPTAAPAATPAAAGATPTP